MLNKLSPEAPLIKYILLHRILTKIHNYIHRELWKWPIIWSVFTITGECLMMNLFDSAQFLLDKGAFINEPIQVGKDKEPVYFYLMKNNPSLVFSPMFMTLMERADLKLIKRFRYTFCFFCYILASHIHPSYRSARAHQAVCPTYPQLINQHQHSPHSVWPIKNCAV